MRNQFVLVLAVLLVGVFLSYVIGRGMFDMKFDSANGEFFAFGAIILGGFPAVLAALPTRAALLSLGTIAGLFGLWGIAVLSTPGDGAIGGFLVLFVDVVLFLYGLAIIGLRKLTISKHSAAHDL